MKFPIQKKLPLKFYKRDVHTVAKELLGKYIVKKYDGLHLSGRIVEVEAYDGNIDEAAHSFIGKTERNRVMFEGGGKLYVYFTYGMHFCANVVTGNVNDGKAILIRAVEPVDGIEKMALNRFGKITTNEKELKNLCSGPAKFCNAYNIDRNDNGTDLTGDSIFIINATKLKPEWIVYARRIGIKKSVDLQWRYYIKENKFVSKR